MTYNVGNGLARPARLTQALKHMRADIIGLQELTPLQAEAIRRDLAQLYPYQVLHGLGIPGKGLLSRFPIQHSSLVELHPKRPDLVAGLSVAGRNLRLIVAHPPPPRLHRTGIVPTDHTCRQVRHLVNLAADGEPALLMGDFNMRDSHAMYHTLTGAGLSDAFRTLGKRGYTFPLRRGPIPLRPVLRLDYIWHTPHLRALDAFIGPDGGSDHLPVLAQMTW